LERIWKEIFGNEAYGGQIFEKVSVFVGIEAD
jgi:hypothetical protein